LSHNHSNHQRIHDRRQVLVCELSDNSTMEILNEGIPSLPALKYLLIGELWNGGSSASNSCHDCLGTYFDMTDIDQHHDITEIQIIVRALNGNSSSGCGDGSCRRRCIVIFIIIGIAIRPTSKSKGNVFQDPVRLRSSFSKLEFSPGRVLVFSSVPST
jgi:hypothetical protein